MAVGLLAGLASAGGGKGKATAFSSQNKNLLAPSQERMLFVWDSGIPGDAQAVDDLFDFVKQHKYNSLALEASPVGYGVPGAHARYADFVAQAKKRSLTVHALIGYGWFTVSPTAGLPDQPTSHLEGFDLVKGIVKSGLFDALVDDSMPYGVTYVEAGLERNYLWDKTQQASQDYVDWLSGVKQILGDMPYYKCSPFWFDDEPSLNALKLSNTSLPRSLASYEAEYADVRVLLAYRDRAWGANGILHVALDDLKLDRTMIAVETSELEADEGALTFFEEGNAKLKLELTLVNTALSLWPKYNGLAVHHYASAKALKN